MGLRHGMRVAQSLGVPVLRQGPLQIGRVAAVLAGLALPVVLDRIVGPGRAMLGTVLFAVAVGGIILARLHGSVEGWKVALGVLAVFVLYSVAR